MQRGEKIALGSGLRKWQTPPDAEPALLVTAPAADERWTGQTSY
jgi:hypothetical protein